MSTLLFAILIVIIVLFFVGALFLMVVIKTRKIEQKHEQFLKSEEERTRIYKERNKLYRELVDEINLKLKARFFPTTTAWSWQWDKYLFQFPELNHLRDSLHEDVDAGKMENAAYRKKMVESILDSTEIIFLEGQRRLAEKKRQEERRLEREKKLREGGWCDECRKWSEKLFWRGAEYFLCPDCNDELNERRERTCDDCGKESDEIKINYGRRQCPKCIQDEWDRMND